MDLIETVVQSFAVTALENYWTSILQLMFHRLSSSKTENITLRFVRFYHLVSASLDKGLGADFFIAASDKVDQTAFSTMLKTQWASNQTVTGSSPYTVDLVRNIEQVVDYVRPMIEQKKYLRNFFDKAAGYV